MMIAAIPVSAQEPTTLTGTVMTESGGVVETGSVFIESLNLGVLTNNQGRYVLIVPAAARAGGATVDVTASLIGRTTEVQTITLQPGTQVLNFVLSEDPLRLAGVTVTALGMERQSRELAIATQQFSGADLSRVEPNLVNALSGKVAGVDITNSGTQGGSSRIVIRGDNSLSSSNQPLFIVDGVPVDNSIGGAVGGLADQGGYDYGNAIQDINAADIESMTVLKGPNAAALYGSRAANGVILIETKKGASTPGGAEITVSQQFTFEDELKLPNYQNTYGQGLQGQFEYYDGFGGGTFDDFDESWGPPLDVGLMIPQWFSPYDAGTDTRAAAPWVSSPDNVDNYFRTGVTATTNVSVAGSTDNLNGRASFSNLNLEGMLPGHSQDRTSFSLAGGIDAFERFRIDASGQYITSEGNNRPGVGYGSDNAMGGFIWFGRQVDTNRLEDLWDQDRPLDEPTVGGYPYSWNTSFWLNPYFKQLANTNSDTRDRLIGQISASYEVLPWLNAMVRIGTDWYQDTRIKTYAENPQTAVSGDYTTSPLNVGREFIDPGGSFGTWGIGFQETNADFLVNATPELDLPFTTNFTFGGNRRDFERTNDYTWVGVLTAPGTFDISNAAIPPDRQTLTRRKRVNSLYGQADFGYEDYLFLTATGRNDWSSTLPEDNRSYFYPSVSASLVFTELTDAVPVSYGKLRASWARVGNDTDPYRLRNTFAADEIWAGLPSFSVPGRLENPDLKPETTVSWEFGTELAFLQNRLGLDVTFYLEETRDQVMPVQLSNSTGYDSRMVNAGTVENRGWEVLLRGTPYASGDLRWESTLTWSKNWNRVTSLAEGINGIELSLGDFWFVSNFARVGEPLGQLVALFDYTYNDDGDILIGADGLPIVDFGPENAIIGNTNADWRAGWGNEVSYKGARLGFLFDWRQGGDIYSVTKAFGRFAGVLAETAEGGRCSATGTAMPGYPVCDASNGYLFDGVVETSPGVFAPNTTHVSQEDAWQLSNFLIPRRNIEDATYIKLRELSLSYSLPGSLTGRWGVDQVDLSLVGRNLFLWTKADHIDPETSLEGTNVQGFEYGQMPTARSFGLNVTVRP